MTKPNGVTACAAALALGLGVLAPAASSARADGVIYEPIQSISHELGSKRVSGYFVQHAAACRVTLMIIENMDPDHMTALSAARIRLVLEPGQIAGLDSEDGRSVNFTCGESAATLVARVGERDMLVSEQVPTVDEAIAEQP